jgi:hypothetical protein
MQPEEIRRKVIDPDGRIVHLTEEAWEHILEHEELAAYEWLVAETISHPWDRRPDVRPERERYFSEGKGPSGYFCVVVEFIGEVGDVITAFGHRNPR